LNITDIYVGHTTDFRKRKSQHKDHCCNEQAEHHHYKCYEFIREHGGWDNWDMILIETRPCNDELEAKKIEREHIEQLQATLNRCIPGRTKQEYKKKYRETHQEELGEKDKLYKEQHREDIREKNKLYREQHKEEIRVKGKLYNEKNKEKINERASRKCICDICGVTHRWDIISKHVKSIRHQKALEAKIQSQEN
jgi:hypothetical protein